MILGEEVDPVADLNICAQKPVEPIAKLHVLYPISIQVLELYGKFLYVWICLRIKINFIRCRTLDEHFNYRKTFIKDLTDMTSLFKEYRKDIGTTYLLIFFFI